MTTTEIMTDGMKDVATMVIARIIPRVATRAVMMKAGTKTKINTGIGTTTTTVARRDTPDVDTRVAVEMGTTIPVMTQEIITHPATMVAGKGKIAVGIVGTVKRETKTVGAMATGIMMTGAQEAATRRAPAAITGLRNHAALRSEKDCSYGRKSISRGWQFPEIPQGQRPSPFAFITIDRYSVSI
jgi:hypothetical protein